MFNWLARTHRQNWIHNVLCVTYVTDVPFHGWLIRSSFAPTDAYYWIRTRGGSCEVHTYKFTPNLPPLEQIEPGETTTHTFLFPACTPPFEQWYMLFPAPALTEFMSKGTIYHLVCQAYFAYEWPYYVIASSRNLGHFQTWDFITENPDFVGVPHWDPINSGINLSSPFAGFKSDPFHPLDRQYALHKHCLYYRVGAAPWVQSLTQAQAMAATGATDPIISVFGDNGLDVDQNTPGFVACTFTSLNWLGYQPWFCYSEDYGLSWHFVAQDSRTPTGASADALTIGVMAGGSPYPAGSVIYSTGRRFFAQILRVSLDRGLTWALYPMTIPPGPFQLAVDPLHQITCFLGLYISGALWHLAYAFNYGNLFLIYDNASPETLGYPAPWLHIAIGGFPATTSRVTVGSVSGLQHIHTTVDQGNHWTLTTPQYRSNDLGVFFREPYPENLILAYRSSATVPSPHTLYVSVTNGQSMYPKSGANPGNPGAPGARSLPYNSGGILNIETFYR